MSVLLNRNDELSTYESGGCFGHYTTTEDFTSVLTDSGTAAVADGSKALVLTPSDGTVADNDEAYIKGTFEAFKFADGKPLEVLSLVQFSEVATNKANVLIGLLDAAGANTILDDGGGPKASYSGAVFFKVDGSTVWQCETSNGASQTTTVTTKTAGGTAAQKLRIEASDYSSTHCQVAFFIDGDRVAVHTVAYASITDKQLVAGAKNGDATNQTLSVFVLKGRQKF